MLKELVNIIAGPFSIVYQRSWESGEVSADCKLLNVTTIYKKGIGEDPVNYIPVILTSVAEKVTEKVILGDTEKLKNKSNIRPSHHGFSESKSLVI